MKINPTGKNIDGRRRFAKIAAGVSSIDTRDKFEKSESMSDLLKEGIRAATLQKESFKENLEAKKKEIVQRVVSNINLPQKEGCSYSEIARLPDGYKELKGFVQGRDGSIYAVAVRPGVGGANNMPGTERMLMAYDSDGNKKWSKAPADDNARTPGSAAFYE